MFLIKMVTFNYLVYVCLYMSDGMVHMWRSEGFTW